MHKCGSISEILNFHTDNRMIEFKCKKCGIYKVFINQYLDGLSNINYFIKCYSCESNVINNKYFYCLNCNKDLCESCKNKYHSKDYSFIEVDKKKKFIKNLDVFALIVMKIYMKKK